MNRRPPGMTYAFLLESVWHPPLAFAESRGMAVLPPELELQALWFSGAFGRDFRTVDGRRVKVVQFGEWNRGAGPDFTRAAVEIDGVLATGDVELDLSAAEWESHGHRANENFGSVILHVVFQPDVKTTFTRTSAQREVPRVLISGNQLADALSRPLQEVAIARPGRCLEPLRHLPGESVDRLLQEAAKHRAAVKARRFLRAIDAHGADEALFQVTAETLGYRGNALSMRILAQRTRLSSLRPDPEAVESVLFGVAGFLSPRIHEAAPADTREYLRGLWDKWWRKRDHYEISAARRISWKTHGQRPANHPHRRIGALAALVKKWPAYRKLALAEPFQIRPLVEFLESLEHDFWSKRHTLTSTASATRIALFGRSQASELLANHLIPLALHRDAVPFSAYAKLGGGVPNEKVKRCALRLFGSLEAAAPWLKRTYQHQALLQVYQDFCLEDFSDCTNCPFPEQLSQWR